MAKSSLSFNITLGIESDAVKTGLDKVVSEFGKLAGETNKALSGIKGFAELKKQIDATGAAHKEATKNVAALAAAVNAPTGNKKTDNQTAKEFERAKVEAGKLKDALAGQRQELHLLRTSLGQAGVSTKSLGAAQKELRTNLENAKKQYADLAKQAQARNLLGVVPHAEITAKLAQVRQAYATLASSGKLSLAELAQAKVAMGRKMEELTDQTNGWRAALMDAKGGLLEIAAAGVGFGLAVRGAMQFESAMADVRKVVDATPAQLAALRQQILGLTREIPLAATEMAAIAAAGGQLGIAPEDIARFTELTAKMSTAFNMSADEAGLGIGKLKNVFAITVEEMGDFGDAINQLGNSSAATEKDIVEVLFRIGGASRQFGLAREQTAALATAMLSLGKTPMVAGTSINALFNRMQTAGSQGPKFQAALAAIGTSAEQMAAAIQKDPQAAITGLLESLAKLSGSDKANILSEMFGLEHQDDIAGLVGGLETYRQALSQVADKTKYAGAMEKEFAARAATTGNQLQLLKNAVSEAGINLGTVFLPAIKAVLTPITYIIQRLADMAEAFPKFSAGLFTLGTGFLVFGTAAKLAGILRLAMVSMAGDSIAAFKKIPAVMAALRTEITLTNMKAAGLKGVLSGVGAVFAAGAVGWEIGTWLNKFEIVQKAGIAMAGGLTVAWLRMKQAWAWATGGDVAAVQQEIERSKDIYAEMFAEVGRKAKASAVVQKKAHDDVAGAAGDSATKQQKALEKTWSAFEKRLAAAQKKISLASSAAEVAAAQKALEYSQAGMEQAEAEKRQRADKLAILDQEIAKQRELLRLVPAVAPEGKSSDDSRATLEQNVNSLIIQRLGLLRDEVESERKASEERDKAIDQAIDKIGKLAEEKARFASHERILAMEEEKLEASKLPTILARAQAEMAINRRISEERIRLKIAEIAALKSLERVDPANIIQAEQALLDLRAAARRIDLENERSIAAERLTILERSWRAGATSAEEYRQAATRAKELGLMEQRDLDEKMVASGNDLSAALSMGWSRAMEKLKTDAEVMTEIGAMLPEQLAGGMVSAFDSFIEGSKTAKEAFIDFARSTINMISQMILKQIILNAISSFGGGGMADGGPVQKLASGGKVHGSSPNDRADNVPIWATAGEYMQPVRAVRHYGTAFMEAVRSLRFPADLARSMAMASLPAPRFSLPSFHLASGGPVPRAAAAPAAGNSTNLQVINVLDKGLVGDYLSTSHGETTILNMIRRNGTTIKAMLGS